MRRGRDLISRPLAALCAAAGAACAALAPAAAAEPLPPKADPFYAPRPRLSDTPRGNVLRSREVTVYDAGVPLTPTVAKGFQVAYRTSDAHFRPVVGVTTLLIPTSAAPKGGRDLVSLQDAEDSLDSTCAPSYQLQLTAPTNGNLAIETGAVSNQLLAGRAIVIPDHEGPRSEYIVTGMEGHATLDSIRAVERFGKGGLGKDTKVGLVGYSGGAHATASAGELAPTYAPELKIAGIAAGGVPVGSQATAKYLDGGVGAGLLFAVSQALNREYPSMRLFSLLNDAGRAEAKKARKGCASSVFQTPFAHLGDYTTVPDPLRQPNVQRVIALNKLGHGTPTAPTFFYNAISDELVWIKPLDNLVAQYCAAGATLDYYRDPAGLEHIQATATFVPLALSYLTDRFAGSPAPSTC